MSKQLTKAAQQRYAAALAKFPDDYDLNFYHAELEFAIHNLELIIQNLNKQK